MKNILLLAIALISSCSYLHAQTEFVEGYIITTDSVKTQCLIKNNDWKFSPKDFKYKLSENGEVLSGNLENVIVFADNANTFKYIKQTVDIDYSSNFVSSYSKQRHPEYKNETVFLKEIISGNASLYAFYDAGINNYFYKIKDVQETITPLVFKFYQTENFKIGKNEHYKQQLLNQLKCEEISLRDIENLSYKEDELVDIFNTYNYCGKEKTVENNKTTTRTTRKGEINTKIKLGVNFTSLAISHESYSHYHTEFDTKANFRGGVELEYVIPFNNNKWSIFLEPTYQSYSNEKTHHAPYYDIDYTVDYSSIELPIGVRHYMYLNDKNAFFIDACYYAFDFLINDEFKMSNRTDYNELSSRSNFGFGVGYKYDKFSIQLKYNTDRDILESYTLWTADYSSTAIIVGYTIF